jgi:phosphatidylserine/phosphatidylglycerophosphate/cardiolipin synthase-like enzyme/outer membrane protein OmpA-like peptidoglycan-associated protein
MGGPGDSGTVDWAAPLAGWDAEAGGGDSNVRWLQATLNQLIGAGLAVDGVAGNATRAAVRDFQGRNNLAQDGVAGPLTVAAMRAALAGGGAPTVAASPTCTGLPVRQTLDRFAFGQSRVEPHHQPQIDGIAACLLASLGTRTPIDGLGLVGHTDTVGDDGANTGLGQRRAEAVAQAIDASLRRQAPGRRFSFVFTSFTRGESEPIPGDPALSRRVDVIAPFTFPPRTVPGRDRPPPPPFRSPLNPPRWGPLLARAISPRATIRTGNAVRHLVDAENPGAPMLAGYNAMVEAIRSVRGGRAFIYLLGWICVDDFDMITCDPTTKLQRLLETAAENGVQVRAVFWEAAFHMRTQRAQTQASADHINALPGGAAIIDGETLNLGSHHQKLLVVGDGERLVGFCGGLDVNPDRILPSTIVCPTPQTRIAQRSRESFEINLDGESDIESMSGGGGNPLHDVHCRVEGPASADLLGTFITRWDHHPSSRAIEARAPLRGRGLPAPAPLTAPLPPQRSATGDTCSVVIGRTFNPRRGSGLPRERDIRAMLLAGIRNARRFIYMEEQYLLNLEAARALRAALPNIQHLTILIAATDVNSDTPCIWTLRREFVEALSSGLPPDQASKVRIFQLVTPPIPAVPPPCTSPSRRFMPTFGRHTYVHAKCWVFDDELAVIGSANCNRRGWEHDTEINASIFDDRVPASATTRTFAQQMRMDLWAEHLAQPASRFVDGVASASAWLRPGTGARVLRYCPDEGSDTFPPQCGILRDTIVDPAAP